MANLSITSECNRDCRYCFARSIPKSNTATLPYMSLQTFRQALDFLQRSEIHQARLLGGEPTLHPEFPLLVEQVMERGLSLLIFSNGLMPQSALSCLENIPADCLSVLMNVGSPGEVSTEARTRQIEVFQSLGSRVLLGLNIDTPAVQFNFLLESIETYGLARTVRLGLAHPIAHGENHFLFPQYYSIVGRKILEFVLRTREIEIDVEFDCGFVPCMFSPEGLEMLGDSVKELGTRCNPILDVLPDGHVISCYPLASLHRESLPDTENASWLRKQFEDRLKPYRSLGIFKECSICGFRENGMCVGGCLAAAMRRLRHDSFSFTLPSPPLAPPRRCPELVEGRGICSDEKERLLLESLKDKPIEQKKTARWVIPYIDQPFSFWEKLADSYAPHIKEVYFPLPGEVLGSGRPSRPTEYLDRFLRNSPFAVSVLINPIILPRPVDELIPQIVEVLKKFIDQYYLAGATVSDLLLAQHIRKTFPELPLTASALMDISQPNQVLMAENVFHTVVPASRIMRNLPSLKTLKAAFPGKLRLMVNEACLPNCPFRIQHFYEMGNQIGHPHSLCNKLLQKFPWMRLTGAWVLPQHLHLYDGVYDELKLAGRVTLSDPKKYLTVLDAYIHRHPLTPNQIGGGPASVFESMSISGEFFVQTLSCRQQCHSCSLCQEYWRLKSGSFS